MKTVKINLPEEALADRGLQMTELVTFLNKEGESDWAENTDNEIVEYNIHGDIGPIYWAVSEPVENYQGTFTFELDC